MSKLVAPLARILGLIAGLAIMGGITHSSEQPTPELPITITNAAATIQEDDPAYDCRTMGNHICGPNNDQGVPAGDYSDNYADTTAEGVEVEITVVDGAVTEDCWQALRSAGYVGRSGDGMEALYVPAIDLEELCGDQEQASWIEHKTDLPDEVIQGDPRLMPAGSTLIAYGRTA